MAAVYGDQLNLADFLFEFPVFYLELALRVVVLCC